MIHAILLNPTIDVIYQINNFHVGGTFKMDDKLTFPAGKAISFALASKKLNKDLKIDVLALIGSKDISLYSNFMRSKQINFEFVPVNGKTRSNKTINDPSKHTTTHIREAGFSLDKSEIMNFKNLLKKKINDGDICVFSGSIPRVTDNKIYFELIKLAKKKKALTCLDSSGKPLINGIKANPKIIKPNLTELSQILNIENINKSDLIASLSIHSEIIEMARKLLNQELEIILITLGKEGAILLSKEEMIYGNIILEYKVIDTVGSGDSFLAGFITKFSDGEKPLICLKNAIAAGAANTLKIGPGILNYNDYERILKKVEVNRIF